MANQHYREPSRKTTTTKAPEPSTQPKGATHTGPFPYKNTSIDRTDDDQVERFKTFKNAKYIGSLATGKQRAVRKEHDAFYQRFTPRETP